MLSDTPMTKEHPAWDEFLERLEGSDGCDFHEDDKGQVRWTCRSKGPYTLAFAKAILIKMDLSNEAISRSLEYFQAHGCYCDCEVVFNLATDN